MRYTLWETISKGVETMYKKLAAAVLCCCLAAALLFTASSVSNVSKAAGDSQPLSIKHN